MCKSKISIRRVIILLCLCTLLGSLTACGTDKNGSKISDDGRSYGGTIRGEVGEKLETAFFDMTVENVEKYDTYQFNDGLYQSEEGKTYVVVTMTIENTYDEDIPMSITDFILDFEGNESEEILTGYGKADLGNDSFMDNIFTLKQEESVTKSILFVVKDKKAYTLEYAEYYEDKFKGDAFEITLVPKKGATNNASGDAQSASETVQEATSTEEVPQEQ